MTLASCLAERAHVDSASLDTAARLRRRALASLSCREAEQLLDGNFRANDEAFAALQAIWEITVRLDCQLGEAARPEDERNRRLQALESERLDVVRARADYDLELLGAKHDVQLAAAGKIRLRACRLAEVLERNVQMRGQCAGLCDRLEEEVRVVARALRDLGVRPEAGTGSADVGQERMARQWRFQFDTNREANDAMLKSLGHPEAALAVPSCSVEERIDENWKFLLELVGLLEKIAADRGPQKGAMSGEAASPEEEDVVAEAKAFVADSKSLLDEVEAHLPALLECKYLAQEAAANGQKPDLAPAERCVGEAQRVQDSVWRFLVLHHVDLSNTCPTKFAEEMLPHPAAFGPARTEAYTGPVSEPLGYLGTCEPVGMSGGYPPVIRALTYNIFMRAPLPWFAHNNGDDKKDERLQRFAQLLEQYDVVCLQEIFGAFSQRRDWLVDVAERVGFLETHRSATSVRPRFLVDGGLLILSRLPIVARASLTFDPGAHLDRLTAKGALYARLRCGAQGPFLHVCTTHFQSTYSEDGLHHASGVRRAQLAQLADFLLQECDDSPPGDGHSDDRGSDSQRASSSWPSSAAQGGRLSRPSRRRWPLLLCGTLNVNGRRSAMDGSHSSEYVAMLCFLQESLGEVRDLLFDIRGSHPVTYADTRLTGGGEAPAERVLTSPGVYESAATKRQCLDYLFFFPHVPAEDSATRRGTSGGGPEPVVPATCQIEKFLVDRAKDVGAPITQLSDHYGVEATFAVVVPARAGDDNAFAGEPDSPRPSADSPATAASPLATASPPLSPPASPTASSPRATPSQAASPRESSQWRRDVD